MPSANQYEKKFEDKPVATSFKLGLIVTLGILAIIAVASVLIWGFKVGTSDVKGRGDAVRQRNDGTNRVFAQQQFEDLKAAIDKDIANIRIAKQSYKNNPSPVNEANVAGTQQICNADVASYNAEARKYLSRDFRASDLPSSIDLAVCQGE